VSARDQDAATVLRVAVPGPIDRLFDYLPPDGIQADAVLPGSRVLVPFGRKRLTGVLVETASGSELATDRLRRAEAVLDHEPALPADLLALGLWAAAYYHHPPGEVLATLLPVALRRGETPTTEPPPRWRITAQGRDALQAGIAGAPVQARLLDLIAAHADGIEASALRTVSDR
jgi:primosomal protein N' (replication factor Y)